MLCLNFLSCPSFRPYPGLIRRNNISIISSIEETPFISVVFLWLDGGQVTSKTSIRSEKGGKDVSQYVSLLVGNFSADSTHVAVFTLSYSYYSINATQSRSH